MKFKFSQAQLSLYLLSTVVAALIGFAAIDNQTWLALAGWIFFFAGVNAPLLLLNRSVASCKLVKFSSRHQY